MRSAAHVFYLAVFNLLQWSHASSEPGKSEAASPNVCAVSRKPPPSPRPVSSPQRTTYRIAPQYEPDSIVSDACASYATLDAINDGLSPYLRSIAKNTDFFSHYRLNLYNKKCPFWSDENGMCGNIACSVNTLDNEADIPLIWRAEELGKLQGPSAHHPGKQLQRERPAEKPLQGQLGEDVGESCVVEYDDECDERDYCVPEDESSTSKGDYVSLVDNEERFTGYSGAGARQVWEAIYRENCFSKPEQQAAPQSAVSPNSFGNPFQAQAAQDLRAVMKEHNIQEGVKQAIAKGEETSSIDGLEFEEECIEKRVFYRVVSGMHASISTHLCYDFLNQTTGKWGMNMECYKTRLHQNQERISNIYFNFALLLRAVGKLKTHLLDYTFCSADPAQNRETKSLIVALSRSISYSGNIFDESVMFRSPDALGLKEDFKLRFRNISRIMDCVGCDKCRLWGKVQTNGYGTALKVLFEFDERNPQKDPPLRRTELVALINTLNRVSHSLSAIKHFQYVMDNPDATDDSPDAHNASGKADRDDANSRRRQVPSETISDVFWEEWNQIWKVFGFVIKSWVSLPSQM